MRNEIRLSAKQLAWPAKDPDVTSAYKQQLRTDQSRRNEFEGVFGSGKRKYSLNLIMARPNAGAESSISMNFLVMCAEKVLRLLRLFFVLTLGWIYGFLRPGAAISEPEGILRLAL